MNLKRKRKIESAEIKVSSNIGKFFDVRRIKNSKPSILFFNSRKLKMFFRQNKYKLSEWRLKRLKAKILKTEENTKNGSLLEQIQNSKSQIPNKSQSPKSEIKKPGFGILNLKYLNLFRTCLPVGKVCNLGFVISKTKYFFKTIKSRTILKKSFALITILAVIVTAYFQNTPYASAATFTLYQTA